MRRNVFLAIFLVFAPAVAYSQTVECPVDMVCLTRPAALKALADADKVIALEKESKAKDDAIAGLRDELNKMRIEFAEKSGENTALKQNAVSDRAIIEILLKNSKKKCMPFSIICL